MCFPRDPVIVIVILRYGSGERLLKYINVGDKSTMVARLPQQVFLLLVLVTGTTIGIGMYGMELPKWTKSSHPTGIRQDGTSGNNPSKKISHKTISRFDEASNSQIPIPKSDSSNLRTKSLEDKKFSSWNQEMHHKSTESKLRSKELKNNYPEEESASSLLNPLTDRVELQSISRRDGFVRLQNKETSETSSSSAFYHSLEDPPSLRSRRTSESFVLSRPTSHPLSLSSSSMTSTFASNDISPTSASSRSLTLEVIFSSAAGDYPKITLPSSSTNTNSIPVSRIFELDKKFSKGADQIEDKKMGSSEIGVSKLERFADEFSKITQPSSSISTDSVTVKRISELDKNLSNGADQIEDKKMESSEIEVSSLERFSGEFSKTTQPSSSISTDSVTVKRISELDKNLSNGADQIEDKKMGSSEIEVSSLERFSGEFSKTTQPSSSISTDTVTVNRNSELDKKFSNGVDQIEDSKIGSSEIEVSSLERFSGEFSKTTQPSSSISTDSVTVNRFSELDKKFSNGVDQIEDSKMGNSEIEVSSLERFSDEFSKTTQPSSSISTDSVTVNRFSELDKKFSNGVDQIEDNKMGSSEIEVSSLERFSDEFSKTTQPSSSISTDTVTVNRNSELDKKFSNGVDQIEDKEIGSKENEVSRLERLSDEFSKTTQPSSSLSTNSIPISRISELDKKFSNGIAQIDNRKMGSSEIEISKLEWFSNEYPKTTEPSLSLRISSISAIRIPELDKKMSNGDVGVKDNKMTSSQNEVSNKFQSFGTIKKIQTTELPTNALSIVDGKKIKSSMWHFTGNENEMKHFDWLAGNRAALTAITLPQTTGFGFSKRYTRDSPEIDICESFEVGDRVKKEFYSPNYPENYPPLANCVLVLEADKGELLKLDFRETFELETRTPDGECRFDYLEVRDGQYGFSPKIGTYCDKTFPPEIISQSRYLWLNFHSDDTIEYQGFKAVWSTVPRPNTGAIPVEQEPCIYYEDIPADFELKSDMIKDAKKISETNRVALDCLWVLKAKETMKMQLTFDSFKLDKPNDCSANFLDIFDGETDEPSRVKKFCGSIAEALSTKTNMMYVRLYLELKAINSTFGALITAVRDKDTNQDCKPDEFDCQDATCIAKSLRCNDRKNCRFQGDESEGECGSNSEKQDRSRIVIILVIFSLIMFGMCTAFVFNCVRKLRRDHRIIREHIRQSREDRLDEIGRRATPCPLSVSRTDLRDGGSESPAGEEVDSSKELIPAATLSTREYTKELTLKMKYGTKEITDIHQSNNVSNATQERLQESSEEPDMCDSSCQTRESLFAPIIPDAILSSPAFSTFGYESIAGPENGLSSHKGTPTSDQSYRNHRHQHHPPPLKQTSQRSQESNRKNSQVSGHTISERCSQEGSAQICPKHNPIPAPPGWSLHDPPYPQIVPEPSGYPGGGDNSSYRRYQSPKPDHHDTTIGSSIYQQHQYQYPPPVFTRQNTVGSGERYGSYIYGSGRASSNTASSNATTTTSATTTPTTSNTTGSGSPHLATPKHSKSDPRYRAEAVIEVDQKRPFSIESTKSAPDVIATH